MAMSAGEDHLTECGTGRNIYTSAVIRFIGSLHDAGLFTELAANLLDHLGGSLADGVDGERS